MYAAYKLWYLLYYLILLMFVNVSNFIRLDIISFWFFRKLMKTIAKVNYIATTLLLIEKNIKKIHALLVLGLDWDDFLIN